MPVGGGAAGVIAGLEGLEGGLIAEEAVEGFEVKLGGVEAVDGGDDLEAEFNRIKGVAVSDDEIDPAAGLFRVVGGGGGEADGDEADAFELAIVEEVGEGRAVDPGRSDELEGGVCAAADGEIGAFDEADARAFEADELRRLDPGEWPALVFAPLPSVCVLDLHWDIEPSWRTLKQAAPGDAAVLSAPAPNPHSVLVWRPQLEVRFRTLTAAAAGLLRAALMGQSFAQVCEHAAAEVGPAHAPSHAAGALREWLADGLFQSWRVVPAAPPQRA